MERRAGIARALGTVRRHGASGAKCQVYRFAVRLRPDSDARVEIYDPTTTDFRVQALAIDQVIACLRGGELGPAVRT